jgi:hypothetical protein
MDPLKPLTTPVAEVRHQASHFVDQYGETWVVIDGIETKVANIKQAQVLLTQQDKMRLDIRARLDEMGIRDMTEKTTGNPETDYVDPETGEVEGVELLPPSMAGGLLIPGLDMAALREGRLEGEQAYVAPIIPASIPKKEGRLLRLWHALTGSKRSR